MYAFILHSAILQYLRVLYSFQVNIHNIFMFSFIDVDAIVFEHRLKTFLGSLSFTHTSRHYHCIHVHQVNSIIVPLQYLSVHIIWPFLFSRLFGIVSITPYTLNKKSISRHIDLEGTTVFCCSRNSRIMFSF